jgi:hypothetical protein
MYYRIIITISLALLFLSESARADGDSWKQDRKAGLVFGLTQPLVLNGFNVEGVYVHNRFIFSYSHGASLDFSGNLLPEYLQNQEVVVHMPFTTGFGVGYRFTEWLNLRVEPKWHRFEFYYEGEAQTAANRIAADARNFSLGLGLYGFFQPFKTNESLLSGIILAPSIRFWPRISSGFDNNRFSYENRRTGNTEELKSLASGMGFSPFIINMSIGYTFKTR